MSEPRIGVVVVHWRGMKDVLDCLESLARLEHLAEIVVVTNGPAEFDEPAARAVLQGFTLIKSPSNRGYAGGCNLGAKHLVASGADLLMFLNDDAVVPPDVFVPIMRAFTERTDAGIVGPVIVYDDDPTKIWFGGGRLNRWLGYTRHIGYGSLAAPRAVQGVDYANGCALVARRDVLERIGAFDESYFHFFDEVDLCERARAAGYGSYVVPSPPVRHKVSSSTGERGSDQLNRRQSYYMTRNRMLFVRRNFTGARRVTAVASQLLLLFPYEALKSARVSNWRGLRGQVEGLFDGILGRAGPRPWDEPATPEIAGSTA